MVTAMSQASLGATPASPSASVSKKAALQAATAAIDEAGASASGAGHSLGSTEKAAVTTKEAPALDPWDVSYAQRLLLCSKGLDVQYKEVEAYMSLQGIIEVGGHAFHYSVWRLLSMWGVLLSLTCSIV